MAERRSATPALADLRGSTTPRLAPLPLITGAPGPCPCGCALTRATSYGPDVIDFAEHVLKLPLLPWQQYLVIHAGELLPGGRPRFKKLMVIVARQSGKTTLLTVLTLFWLFVEQWPLVIGQHGKLAKAREVWEAAFSLAERNAFLSAEVGKIWRDNNQPRWVTSFGSRYVPEAANRDGGRGGSADRIVVDEARQQRDWLAYNALKPTLNARPYGQGWWISNQGDATSVVLLSMRKTGLANIEGAADIEDEDADLGLFEWSAPPGSDMLDPVALCMANPSANLKHGVPLRALLADAKAAIETGDQEQIAGFKTEIMCMYVPALDAAVDPDGWARGRVPGELSAHRSRLALVPELSPDQLHASLTAAALLADGSVRVEVVASWSGSGAAADLRRALPGWVRKVKPRKLGWLGGGPVEAIAAELTPEKFPGTQVERISSEVSAVCMGFAELVLAGQVLHSGQADAKDLLSKQVLGSAKLWRGDTWRFSRKGEGHCDTAYGAAGAAHLARTMPPPPQLRSIVTANS